MTLAFPKSFTVVSPAIRQSARGRACTLRLDGCDGGGETAVLAHLRGNWALGLAKKPDDTFGVYACRSCHAREEMNLGCTDHDRLRALYETQHQMIAEGLIVVKGASLPRSSAGAPAVTHTFKRGDAGLTRDGRKFEVLADDMGAAFPLAVRIAFGKEWDVWRFTSAGRGHPDIDNASDLMPPPPPVTDEEVRAFADASSAWLHCDGTNHLKAGLAAAFAVREARK